MSDLKIDGQTSIETADLLSISDATEQIKDCSHVICPDTNVLLRMVTEDAKMRPILQLNAWLEQMKYCRKLLDDQKVGWIITEQVKIELLKNKNDLLESANSLMDGITQDLTILNYEIKQVNHQIKQAFTTLKNGIKDNFTAIEKKAIILKEEEFLIYKAWELVNSDIFPNEKKQQMKDTVILCHLLEFRRQLENTHPVYFWTFDKFDNPKVSKFPKKHQNKEPKKDQNNEPKRDQNNENKSDSYIIINRDILIIHSLINT